MHTTTNLEVPFLQQQVHHNQAHARLQHGQRGRQAKSLQQLLLAAAAFLSTAL